MPTKSNAKNEGRGWKNKKHDVFLRDKSKSIDASIEEKRAYDFLCREQEAKLWIEEMINEKLPEGTANFVDNLRNGEILCKLANVFAPGVIKKINKVESGSVLQFMATDNINKFFNACLSVNFPKVYLFSIPDIWEKKNILNVVHCLHALAHYLSRDGKFVKIKDLSKAGIKFDEEEIAATKKQLQELEESPLIKMAFLGGQQEQEATQESDTESLDDLADPDECKVIGEGASKGTAGVESKFIIEARDTLGNQIEVGGEEFSVVLFHQNSKDKIVANVKDLENGKYEVTYTPEKSGDYSMEIHLHDTDEDDEGDKDEEPETLLLKGCPMKVVISPAPTSDPAKASISGLGATSAVAGTAAKFIVQSYDKFGNPGAGGENFTASLTKVDDPNVKIDAKVTDLGDGTYSFEYTCPQSGIYNLEVKLGDKLCGQAQKIVVKDAGISDPTTSVVEGVISSLKAGEKFHFVVHAKDKHGNQRESGGEAYKAVLIHKASGEETEIKLEDTNDGRYSGDVTPEKSGEYELQILLGETKVKGSPFTFTVSDTGESDATKCTFIAPKEGFKAMKAGEKRVVIVEARDKFGNLREKGGETFIGRLTSKTKLEVLSPDHCVTTDTEKGTYEISFTAEEAGEYALEILHQRSKEDAENITGFPVDLTVVPDDVSDPSKTKAQGEGLSKAVSNHPAQFTVITFDKFGNQRAKGGDEVKVTLLNKKKETTLAAEVTDLEDGTYEVNYLPNNVGLYEITITVNKESISKEPFILKVAPPVVKDLTDKDLEAIHDHDLLNSLINEFNDDESDSLVGEIQDLRTKLIEQIRENLKLEKSVSLIEKKIELLINNRVNVEEVMKSSRGLLRRFRRRQTVLDKKGENKDQTKSIEHYSNLFYLLQTEPKYLARILIMVPTGQVDKFLETVILTLYGYAFSAREEYLILNLFKQTLQLEVAKDQKKVGSFLNSNPVLPKMVMTYGRRLQGKQYLQKVLFNKIIEPILNDKDLDLELNAVKLLKEHISNQEVDTGVKSEIDIKSLTYEKAMKEDYIKSRVEERVKKLSEICSRVLQGMTDNVNEIPYGLRYVCKQLDIMLKEKHPKSTESERGVVIGYLVYYRFMNPAIVSPEGFGLTKKKITPKMRNNLILISKMMTNLSNAAEFDDKMEEHMTLMNSWLKENEKPYLNFIQKLIAVPDPEDQLGVDEYMELTQKTAPTISITWNEIYSTHGLLNKYLLKLAPEKDDPLRQILSALGNEAPSEVPLEENEEIKLPLVNKFQTVEKNTETTADQLYEATKEHFRHVLKVIPPEGLGDDVTATLKKTRAIANKLLEGNEGDENAKKLLQRVNAIEEALPGLEKAGKVSPSNNYRQMLVDITKELQNVKEVRKKQKKEFERLKESLIHLQQHEKYLKEKINDFDEYIVDSQRKQYMLTGNTKRKKRLAKKIQKTYKFSYNQLKTKGVIKSMNVMKSQRNKVQFLISMPEPGEFAVDAKVAGLTVKTITLKLEDLLTKKDRGEESIDLEYVTLDVNMTLHTLNKLFMVA